MKILFFDVETTGTNAERHAVIQYAHIIEIDGKVVDERSWTIKPHDAAVVEPKAIEINGIGKMV